jgi:peptidoglycan/LPS O-acetylase OafA/YrhL
MKRLGHVPALDGVRGLAIALVVCTHYFHHPAGGAGAGVGLFFVLSGYLITTLLVEEYAGAGRIRLRAFYVRRARRLFPALALLLAVYLVVATLQGRSHAALRAVAAGGFYTANIAQAYWPHLIGHEPIGPLWSLAEEEQFYLLWPALLILALAYKLRGRYLEWLIGGAILAIWFERFWLYYADHAAMQRLYTSPESAADRILAGVLLALLLRRGLRIHPLLGAVGLWLFLFLVVVGAVGTIGGPIIDVAAFVIVGLAVEAGSGASRVLSWRPLVWLGLISYSLYLWHIVVLSWFGYQERGIALAASVAVAWLSYRFVETRFRRRRQVAGAEGRLDPLLFGRPAAAPAPATQEV